MAAEKVTSFPRPLHGCDILEVFDGPNLPGVGAAVRALSATYEHVPDVATALDRLMHDTPRLLITALELPDRNGLELLAALDALFLDTDVIVVEPRVQPRMLAAGRSVKAFGASTASGRIEQSILEIFSGPRTPTTHPRFAIGDYLRLAMAYRQSVDIRFRLSGGELAQLEIVGGDLWNAFVDDREGERAMELLTLDTVVRSFEARRLATVPGRRQVEVPGLGALDLLGDAGGPETVPDRPSQVDTHPFIDATEIRAVTRRRSTEPPAASTATSAAPPTVDPVSAGPQTPPAATTEAEFAAHFDAGLEAALARDYPRAIAAFEAALAVEPDDTRARFNLERIRKQHP